MSPDRFLLELPKAELHVHLEGSIRPETLLSLARRRRVDLPVDSVEGLREWFEFRDFEHFVDIYLKCSQCLRDPEDFQLLVRDFMAEQARQNILYSEAHLTIGTHLMNGCNGREVRDALWEAVQEAERQLGVRLRLITDIVRNVPYRWADATVEWALEAREHGVVALGLSGYEATHPAEPFRAHFGAAKQGGLHRVAHAGEHAGPQAIRDVLEICEAERIGHGVRAVEDSELVDRLAADAIPLEVCLTSNVRLGVFPCIEAHSFGRLHEVGCCVTIHSDDPPLFNTDLTREYQLAAETWGYSRETMVELARRSFQAAFVDEEYREELLGRLEAVAGGVRA